MSRAYRIKVSESLHKIIRAEDRVSTCLEILNVLPQEEMAELLAQELQRRGYPAWVTKAILSHANYSGVPRETPLEHTLFACDEMAGFVTAAALVRPSKSVFDLEPASVIKRMKDKAFARAVSRDVRRYLGNAV